MHTPASPESAESSLACQPATWAARRATSSGGCSARLPITYQTVTPPSSRSTSSSGLPEMTAQG